MRIALGLVLVVATACGGQQASTLGESSPSPSVSPSLSETTVPPEVTPSPTPNPTPPPSPAPRPSVVSGGATVGGTGKPSPSSAPATVAPTASTTVVTDDSSGSTVRLRVGQRLRVRLSKDSYDPPTSSAPASVVRRSSAGGYPSDQPVDAVFEAVKAGSADVTAQTDYTCFHTEPRCLRPTRQWTVHVIVS